MSPSTSAGSARSPAYSRRRRVDQPGCSDGTSCHTRDGGDRPLFILTVYLTVYSQQKRFSMKGARSMHSFAHHHHSESGEASAKETHGLILNGGWRHDLMTWFIDTFAFSGNLRELRQRTANLARIQPGEKVLDVGCGTGTLAIEVQQR